MRGSACTATMRAMMRVICLRLISCCALPRLVAVACASWACTSRKLSRTSDSNAATLRWNWCICSSNFAAAAGRGDVGLWPSV